MRILTGAHHAFAGTGALSIGAYIYDQHALAVASQQLATKTGRAVPDCLHYLALARLDACRPRRSIALSSSRVLTCEKAVCAPPPSAANCSPCLLCWGGRARVHEWMMSERIHSSRCRSCVSATNVLFR
jgi:hypothetical protein